MNHLNVLLYQILTVRCVYLAFASLICTTKKALFAPIFNLSSVTKY